MFIQPIYPECLPVAKRHDRELILVGAADGSVRVIGQ